MVVARVALGTTLPKGCQAIVQGLGGEEETFKVGIVELFHHTVAAKQEDIVRADIRHDMERGFRREGLMGLHGTRDDIALGKREGFFFGEFTGSQKFVDQRMIARLIDDAMAWTELIDAAVTDIGEEETVGAASKEGERGTHRGFTLFFLLYAIVKTIQVLIGRREGISESLLHLKGGDGVCPACATADGISHATAGQFAMGMTAYAVAKHQNGLLGSDLLGIGEEGIFLIGLLPDFTEGDGARNGHFHRLL